MRTPHTFVCVCVRRCVYAEVTGNARGIIPVRAIILKIMSCYVRIVYMKTVLSRVVMRVFVG